MMKYSRRITQFPCPKLTKNRQAVIRVRNKLDTAHSSRESCRLVWCQPQPHKPMRYAERNLVWIYPVGLTQKVEL